MSVTNINKDVAPSLMPTESTTDNKPSPVHTARSGRTVKAASKFADSTYSSLSAYAKTFSPTLSSSTDCILQPRDLHYTEPSSIAQVCEHMLSLIAADPDTLTLKEALAQPDRAQFIAAMYKELEDHISRGH